MTEIKFALPILLLLVGGWVGLSYFEAKAFNKVVQPLRPVTTWDAMFVSLRVNANPRP